MNAFYMDLPVFEDVDRLQRQVEALLTGGLSSVRAERSGNFPAINIGSTEKSVEIIAFVPGVDAKTLNLTIDKGLLSLVGERKPLEMNSGAKRYAHERFSGSFRRVIELPQNVDSSSVEARYSDGCVRISIAKEEPSAPKSISIQ